jgi:hypothetical protein
VRRSTTGYWSSSRRCGQGYPRCTYGTTAGNSSFFTLLCSRAVYFLVTFCIVILFEESLDSVLFV